MKVKLTYFKDSGKYYSEGEYNSNEKELYEIHDEVRVMIKDKCLPGLMENHSSFIVLVNVPGHEHEHPILLRL